MTTKQCQISICSNHRGLARCRTDTRGVLEADSMAMESLAMSHELDLFYMSLSDFTCFFNDFGFISN